MAGLSVPRLEVSKLTRISHPVWSALLAPAVPCQALKGGVVSEVATLLGPWTSLEAQTVWAFLGLFSSLLMVCCSHKSYPGWVEWDLGWGKGPLLTAMTFSSSPSPRHPCQFPAALDICILGFPLASVRDLPSPFSCSRGSWGPGTGLQACLPPDRALTKPAVPSCVPHVSPTTAVQTRGSGGLSRGFSSHSQGQLCPTQLLLYLLPPAVIPMEPIPCCPLGP